MIAATLALETKLFPHNYAVQFFTFMGALLLALSLGHFAEPKSAVILRYSYDQVARSEERNSKILIAAVSAALGVAATLLGMYAKHKLGL